MALKKRYSYIFDVKPYPGAPSIELCEVTPFKPFQILDMEISPFTILHGNLPILGFKVEDVVYITDGKTIPKESKDIIKKGKCLILNALQNQTHHSHFTLEEALTLSKNLQLGQTYFTHCSHKLGKHRQIEKKLPEGTFLGYDFLEIEIE